MQRNLHADGSEVSVKASRRRYAAADKARILDEYDVASDIEKAAICRREKVYSSLLSSWRLQRANGKPLSAKPGRKPKAINPSTELDMRVADLKRRLEKAERIIDIQGKAYALLRACVGESADQMDLPPWQKSS